MTEREFCYWLQGLFEVAEPYELNAKQTAMISDHLKLVFTKVTPVPRLSGGIVHNDLLKGLQMHQPGPLMGVATC